MYTGKDRTERLMKVVKDFKLLNFEIISERFSPAEK